MNGQFLYRTSHTICTPHMKPFIKQILNHCNFNRGWPDRVFLNCGWLYRGNKPFKIEAKAYNVRSQRKQQAIQMGNTQIEEQLCSCTAG